MSVSLCAFRLEVSDSHPAIDFEQYQAPKLGAMASGGGPVPEQDLGGSRRRPRRQHDRRLIGPITVETVLPPLLDMEKPSTSGATPHPGGESSSGETSTSDAAVAEVEGKLAGEVNQAGPSSRKSAKRELSSDASSSPSTAVAASAERAPPRAVADSSPPAAGAAREGTPPPPAESTSNSGASPPQPELASLKWDRDRPPGSADVLIGPSGKAVSYADLVKSGREPSLPPRASKEGTPADESQLEQKPFVSGNPFVEVTQGLLHLYKENTMTSLEDGVERSEMICMLSVPAKMVIHDLLHFTAPCYRDIERMRIIRDNTPNQYMVLIKFRSQAAADEFYRNFNGVLYNSLDPETCHLVYVSRVDVVNESDDARLPIPGFTELPTCPVCLERMDESVDGVLTVLCNHTFHGSCLSQWGDTSCPVCRFVQTPELVEDNFCFECQAGENLWICLICGHVGCGRYVGGHAYSHFLDTGHTYTMRVGSTRVWDYVGDNFVHRLVQNNDDGKMVEVDNGGYGPDSDKQMGDCEEKLEGIQLEYTYLLTSQLQSQRQYYEERISRIEKEAQIQSEELKERTRASVEETILLKEKVQQAATARANSEKKVTQLTQRLNRCLKELQDEQEINKSLHENQSGWQQRVQVLETKMATVQQQKDQEVAELKDQVRDLMFFLETQQKIASSPAGVQQELAEGNIVVPDAPPPSKPSSGARRKRR